MKQSQEMPKPLSVSIQCPLVLICCAVNWWVKNRSQRKTNVRQHTTEHENCFAGLPVNRSITLLAIWLYSISFFLVLDIFLNFLCILSFCIYVVSSVSEKSAPIRILCDLWMYAPPPDCPKTHQSLCLLHSFLMIFYHS